MNFKNVCSKIKKFWNWIWKSDSIWSWIIALILIFILIKFIIFPLLSLIAGTSLPLAGVDSSSMDHQIVQDIYGRYTLCGTSFIKEKTFRLDFKDYWEYCGDEYSKKGITEKEFSEFTLKNGFSKGDVMIITGRFTPKIGDVIVFKPNKESTFPNPIIHRIVEINKDGTIQTKGDHNEEQLIPSNNVYGTDETNITEKQIMGKAIFKIPYLGYPKLWVSKIITEIFN
jgi:hypothetical protein